MKMPHVHILWGLAFVSTAMLTGFAEAREPQFPLKTSRVIYTDAMIEQARANVAQYPSAKELAGAITEAADAWLAWEDKDLRALIPSADVPRAFNVGTAGCPKCGTKIYEARGTYPWKLDLKKPFKVKCPVCNTWFPDNDFKGYYESGFKDKACLEGEYADDGWGWVGPPGDHRYWFVAYANHWTLHSHVIPAIRNCAMAYLLTGSKPYAHKAAVLLDRAAEVYPDLDYHSQSRYGKLTAEAGGRYPGKFVNLIWATGNLGSMACAYDAVWETVDTDDALQSLTGKTGEQIRANIEANLLEEGIDGVFAEEIRGNFGMHQRALVFATLARQHGKTNEWLDTIFTRTGCSPLHTGLNYALYNLVYRDGVPYETSPGYNSGWVSSITQIAETLKDTDRSVYALPKARRLYDWLLDLICAAQYTPSTGDSGGVQGSLISKPNLFQAAWRAFQDPRYLAHLARCDAVGDKAFTSHDSLFAPPIEGGGEKPRPQPPRLLEGYGMAILNNPQDTLAASMYYGFKGGHGHFDRLNIDIFANGRPMTPDTGYPDFMNGYVPGIYTWSKNTIAHNTVAVDAQRQLGNQAGTVHLFADGAFARVVDVDAPETYPQCSTYRRHFTMVDVDAARSYFVDFFTVQGGKQHDYSLHGPPGEAAVTGGEWKLQEKGTLAGGDVDLGAIYDDPVRRKEGFAGTYYAYTGSGFQHLFHVQRLVQNGDAAPPWFVQYAHSEDDSARLRLRVLSQTGTEHILADAQVSPVKQKDLLKYVIARRQGEELESVFVSVLEPFKEAPFIESARRLDLEGGATAVVVQRQGGLTDIVVHNPAGAPASLPEFGLRTDARSAVVTLGREGKVTRAFAAGGTKMAVGQEAMPLSPGLTGEIVAVDPEASKVRVRLEGTPADFAPASLAGRVVHFENGLRRTAHPIIEASQEGAELVLTTRDELLVGRARITAVGPDGLRTNTAFQFAPVYRGTYVGSADLSALYPITGVELPDEEDAVIRCVEPLPEGHPFEAGADAWIVNVGPGDRFEAPEIVSIEKSSWPPISSESPGRKSLPGDYHSIRSEAGAITPSRAGSRHCSEGCSRGSRGSLP